MTDLAATTTTEDTTPSKDERRITVQLQQLRAEQAVGEQAPEWDEGGQALDQSF